MSLRRPAGPIRGDTWSVHHHKGVYGDGRLNLKIYINAHWYVDKSELIHDIVTLCRQYEHEHEEIAKSKESK